MAHLYFHNNTVSLNDIWYESHASLLKSVCMELGQPDKIEELLQKYLNDKMKIKAKKDPNMPKRAKSGFMFFCDEFRPKLIKKFKDKNEKVNISLISKELGNKWKKLKNEKRVKYDTMAKKDKERYTDEMSEYKEANFN